MAQFYAMSLVSCALLVGCGGGSSLDPPPLHPVSGTIVNAKSKVYTGGGMIEFRNVAKPEFSTTGVIDKRGAFTLHTLVVSKDGRLSKKMEGAQEGDHIVTISPDQGEDQKGEPIQFKKKYKIEAGPNNLKVIIESE